jgi:hypothetical protein
MSLRRLFLLGTATVASVAALVAIAAILTGEFGETEGRIFATLATTFVAGSTLIAGLALLGRDASRGLGLAGVGLAIAGFVLWSAQIWGEFGSDRYWKLLGVLTAWALAVLVATTTRLMLSTPSLIRWLYPATAGAVAGAALVATLMILAENGDGWQLFAVLLVLALLGETLAPVLERFQTEGVGRSERLLGVVAGVEVLAVRGQRAGSIQIGSTTAHLAAGESIVVRERL